MKKHLQKKIFQMAKSVLVYLFQLRSYQPSKVQEQFSILPFSSNLCHQIKIKLKKNFPNRFFIFLHRSTQKTIQNDAIVVAMQIHFYKVIPASRRPWARSWHICLLGIGFIYGEAAAAAGRRGRESSTLYLKPNRVTALSNFCSGCCLWKKVDQRTLLSVLVQKAQ